MDGLANPDIQLTLDWAKLATIRTQIPLSRGKVGSQAANGDDGIGLLTTYTTDPSQFVTTLNVSDNNFQPAVPSDGGFRALLYINTGVNNFNFTGNTITGDFAHRSITEANVM